MNPDAESTTPESFIVAKVHGMRSKLFEGNRLTALAESKSLPELFRRVRPGDTFEDHLTFERHLLGDQVREVARMLRYLSGPVFHLVRWLLLHYELENLKVVLRAYLSKEPLAEAEQVMAPVPAWLALPTSRLLEAPDLRGFAALVPVEEFRGAMLQEIEAERAPDSAALETGLDAVYCRRLLQLSDGMDEWIRKLTAFDVDIHNLSFLLRSKFNYNLPLAKIQPFIVTSGVYLTPDIVERVYAAHDLAQAVNLVPRSLLPPEKRRGIISLQKLDEALLLRQYQLASLCFAESIVAIPAVVAYCYVRRIEFMNLVRVTESVRHSLPRADIENRLLSVR
jgi:V/A-type H+-transporting ATPase subunit C